MISADEMLYRYAAVLALLLNVLGTAMLVVLVRDVESFGAYVPAGVVFNLFSYLVIIAALRHPKYV